MTTKVGIHITSNNQSMLSNYTTALPSKSRPRGSHERKNSVLTTNFVGIEICNAEWKSRVIPEMLFKLIGIHMTTLLMVAEYATSLNKSSAESVPCTCICPLACMGCIHHVSASIYLIEDGALGRFWKCTGFYV